MSNLRLEANNYRKEGNYLQAINIYDVLWQQTNLESIDKWLAWEYAFSLKKVGELDKAIFVCKKVYEKDKGFNYINNLLAWCLYERYIRNKDQASKNISYTSQIAEFILVITNQSSMLPYEKTIWRMIELYKNPFIPEKVNLWLDKLNVDLLSTEESVIHLDGKEKKILSDMERWYLLKSKCLLNLKKYDECIKISDIALVKIKKFYNDNEIWIMRNKSISLFHLGKSEEAIDILKKLIEQKDCWFLHNSMFDMQIELDNYNYDLEEACKAALMPGDVKSKVNLYYKIGKVLEKQDDKKNSFLHYLLSKYIREENGWKVSDDLLTSINRVNADLVFENYSRKNVLSMLEKYWTNVVLSNNKRLNGIINNINLNRRYGFIQNGKEKYYFKLSSVWNQKKLGIHDGDKVSFELIESYDKKKQIYSKEAIEIILISNK